MLLSASVLLLIAVTAAPAAGASGLDDAQRKAKATRAELDEITAQLERFEADYHANQAQLDHARRQAGAADARYRRARTMLDRQAATMVRTGGVGMVSTLFEDDASTMLDRMEFIDVVMRQQTDWVKETRDAEAAHEAVVREIETRAARARQLLASAKAEESKLEDKFRTAKQQILSKGGLGSVAGLDGIAEVSGGIACPLEPPYSFINSWGFARSGGRTHKGTDMMAPLGATVFAFADGVVSEASSIDRGLSGRKVKIKHPGGVETWYFHLDTVRARAGQKVSAGDVIGTNGSTGNAAEGGEHVHFEYHINGAAVNPWPFAAKACPGH
jgi:murein DD-endopeptidase MepM/ murein hydrolase activator NlpD